MNEELKKIRKDYGEKIMHTCRSFFPQFLGKGDLVYNVLTKYFAPTHSLYEDLDKRSGLYDFRDFIDSILYGAKEEAELTETDKDPYTLMDEAGYRLYECETEAEIQSFRHYYEPHEELCTFIGGRLERCRVFFAVKKNVDEIRREDFDKPEREDLYGTSVISIQFTKTDTCSLSIKNRYNHTVNNPDATFYNNLERIIPGLTISFQNLLGKKINSQDFESARIGLHVALRYFYIRAKDGRYYRFNSCENEIYFCENNVLVTKEGPVFDFVNNKDSNRFLIVNHCIIDLQENEIFTLRVNKDGGLVKTKDSFVKSIYDVGAIDRFLVNKEKDGKTIVIKYKDGKIVTIKVDKNNAITEYENNYVTMVGDKFLQHAGGITKLTMNNVIEFGSHSLEVSEKIESLSIPKVKVIKEYSFANVHRFSELSFLELEVLGDFCFHDCFKLEEFNVPKLKYIGNNVLCNCNKLRKVNLPSVKEIKNGFMANPFYANRNEFYYELSGLSNLEKLGDSFLGYPNKILVDFKSMGIDYPTSEVSLKEFYDILINQKHVVVDDPDLERVLNKGNRI